jgi:hypothetical protein
VNKTYADYKIISVSDMPSINNVNIDINVEEKSADVSWDNSVASSYLIDWWVE